MQVTYITFEIPLSELATITTMDKWQHNVVNFHSIIIFLIAGKSNLHVLSEMPHLTVVISTMDQVNEFNQAIVSIH